MEINQFLERDCVLKMLTGRKRNKFDLKLCLKKTLLHTIICFIVPINLNVPTFRSGRSLVCFDKSVRFNSEKIALNSTWELSAEERSRIQLNADRSYKTGGSEPQR